MARVLVTGGAGFIGSNLVHALLERGRRGARARQLLHREPRRTSKGSTSRSSRASSGATSACTTPSAEIEVVYHLGALGSVPRSVQDPLTSSAVNIEGTLNVLLAARDEGVRRVVFSSSASVYGSSRQMPTTEESPPDPISPYGVAKLAAERYCVSFSRVYESFESVVLRYFNVFGPRQSPFSQYAAAVPLFITTIAAGEPIDDLRRRRAVARLHVRRQCRRRDDPRRRGRGRERRDLQRRRGLAGEREPVAETIGEILGKPVERRHLPSRAGDIRDSWADLSKSERVLGYAPEIALEDGLRRTVDFLL